jgi:hypothetical protein
MPASGERVQRGGEEPWPLLLQRGKTTGFFGYSGFTRLRPTAVEAQ